MGGAGPGSGRGEAEHDWIRGQETVKFGRGEEVIERAERVDCQSIKKGVSE